MYRILLVEDDPEFRSTLAEVLLGAYPEAAVREAGSGEEALDRVDGWEPDIVFMDIGLPDTGGLELTRLVLERHPQARVIVLTGHNLPEYRRAAARAGASGFAWKGDPSDVLLRLVREIA